MAMPVVVGAKSEGERFPGAVETFSIEALMQDGKALQAGTSHFLGQNFSKVQNITFQNDKKEIDYAWTTSWGVSTRLIGGLIMTHADDDGLIIPKAILLSPTLKSVDAITICSFSETFEVITGVSFEGIFEEL